MRHSSLNTSILVTGAVNVDLIAELPSMPPIGGAVHASSSMLCQGGHAANCATVLARLGGDARLLAAVGTDPLGEWLRSSLQGEGVDVSMLQDAPGPTGMAVVALSSGSRERSMILAPGANEALRSDLREQCGLAVVFDPPLDVVCSHGSSRKRPWLYCPGSSVSRYKREEILAAARSAAVLVVNEHEAGLLAGFTESGAAARRLFSLTGRPVCVTLGRRGSILHGADGTLHQPAQTTVCTVDPTGAGDAFAAGLAFEMVSGRCLKDALGFASRVAAEVVSVWGATGPSDLAKRLASQQETLHA